MSLSRSTSSNYEIFTQVSGLNVRGGRIYTVCRQVDPRQRFFEVLDDKGSIVEAFGRESRLGNVGQDILAGIDYKKAELDSEGTLWLAWEYFPWIYNFSEHGELLNTLTISDPELQKWGRNNISALKKARSYRGPLFWSIIQGIRSIGNNLFLLSPCKDGARIICCRKNDGLQTTFVLKTNSGEIPYYKDFEILEQENDFLALLLQASPESRIDVYSLPKKFRGNN